MSKYVYSIILILFTFMASWQVEAQTDTPAYKFEIRRTFTPGIKEGERFFSQPLPETAYVAPPIISYQEAKPGKAAQIHPNLPILKAIALPTQKPLALNGNFIKTGIGNFTAFLMEGSFMNLRSKTLSTGINFHSFSNNGKLYSRQWADNNASLYIDRFFEKVTWKNKAGFEFNKRKFYGYEKSFEKWLDKSDLNSQIFTWDFSTEIQSRKLKQNALLDEYNSGVQYYFLNNNFKHTEQQVKLFLTGEKKIRENPLTGKLSMIYNAFDGNYIYNRLYIHVNPSYKIGFGKLKVDFGGRMLIRNDNNGNTAQTKTFFYPDLHATYSDKSFPVTLKAGFTGDQTMSTRKEIFKENPFASGQIFLGNMIQNQIYLHANGHFSENYEVQLGYKYFYNTTLPIFYNTYIPGYMTDSTGSFSIIYQTLNYSSITAQFGFHQKENLIIRAEGKYNIYEFKEDSIGLMRPNAELKIHYEHQIKPKYRLRADLYAVSARRAGNADSSFSHFKPVTRLKGFIDANIMLIYKHTEYISGFIQIANLSNRQYAMWYRYPVNGINIIAGFTISL